MRHFGKFLIVAMLMAACSVGREQEAQELIKRFYQTHQSHRPKGALSLQELITFRRFLSAPLFTLLKDVSIAEEARLARAIPPMVDADLFTAYRTATYRVLACDVSENRGRCCVELTYSDTNLPPSFKSIDRVVLTRDARGWVIDNIEYGDNIGARQGNLQQSLQTILGRTRHY